MSATTRFTDPTLPEPPALYLALELSNRSWKLAFSTGHGQKPRFRTVPARDLDTLTREIALARQRFELPDSVSVIEPPRFYRRQVCLSVLVSALAS